MFAYLLLSKLEAFVAVILEDKCISPLLLILFVNLAKLSIHFVLFAN
jgi:hypothetical protein